jgi:hypothetical protein
VKNVKNFKPHERINMEIKFETMYLSDLKQVKSILEERLAQKEKWRDSQRGYSYEEWVKRDVVYHADENHSKLQRVNQRIEDFINAV